MTEEEREQWLAELYDLEDEANGVLAVSDLSLLDEEES